MGWWSRGLFRVGAVALVLLGCRTGNVADYDELYYQWDDKRVICSLSIDRSQGVSVEDVEDGLDRVRRESSVLVLYGHEPRGDSPLSIRDLDGVLAAIRDSGVPFMTFRELASGERRPGVVVSFDDLRVDSWYAERETFASYGAVVTFFVTRFNRLDEDGLGKFRELELDGHEIASHGLNHVNAASYVEQYGVSAYIEDEVLPSLEAMRASGFDPRTYAYPLGSRTADIDRAVLEYVELVRTTSVVSDSLLVSDPCPE